MSAKYKSPSFLLPNELNTSANTANDTGINSLYSMDFDGSSYINAGRILSAENTSTLSVSFWLKIPSTGAKSYLGYFIGNFGAGWLVEADASSIYFVVGDTNTGYEYFSLPYSGNITINTWYNIVMVFDGTQTGSANILKVYINGTPKTLSGSPSFPSSIPTLSGAEFTIGGIRPTTVNGVKSIDEVAIFNKALNTTEIAALYDGTGSNIRPSNLMAANLNPIAYYPLGEQAQNSGYPSATGNEWQFPNGVLQDYVMDFDGTSPGDAITSNTSGITGNTARTISFWYNIGSSSSAMIPFSLGGINDTNSNSQFAYCINRQDTETTAAIFGRGGNDISPITVPATNDSQWHNVIITYTGSTLALYIDGSNITLPSQPSAYATTDGFKIGGWSQAGNRLFDGKMSNVVVWNTDQSANLANIYNNGSPQTSYTVTPQNWWKLNADSVYTPSAPNYTTALDFVSSESDYIDCGDSDSFSFGDTATDSPFSISAWVNMADATNFITIAKDANSGREYVIRTLSDDKLYFYLLDNINGGYVGRISSGTVTSNQSTWIHTSYTYNGNSSSSGIKIYLNGSQVDNNNYEGGLYTAMSNTSTNLNIGRQERGLNYANGSISNVAIFNTALTQAQVSTLFNFGTPETNISFDPVAWWKLNDQTAITDYSGNGNTGTNNGAANAPGGVAYVPSWKITSALPITTPNYTKAIDFPRSNSNYINTSFNPSTVIGDNASFTISSWVRPTDVNNFMIFMGSYSSSNNRRFFLGVNSSGGNIEFGYGGANLTLSADINVNVWQNIILVYDNSAGYFYGYVNGQLIGSYNFTSSATISTANIRIGTAANLSLPYGGDISNLAIYDSALSQPNVSTIYNSGTPQNTIFGSPVAWWKLDNTTTITDSSNNGYTGTIVGSLSESTTDVLAPQPVNGVSTTLPSTALQQSDLQFDSPYSNYSLSFDGADDYIDCTDNDMFSFGNGTTDSPFSVSFWVKLNSVSGTQPFLSKDTTNPNREWAISIFSDSSNGVRIFLKNQGGDTQQSIDSSTALTTGVWYHITTTYDGRGGSNAADGLNIYINGSLDTPTNISKGTYTAMSNTTAPVYIGKYSSSEINGKIDETAIWNTALTEAQVLEIYNNGKPGNLDNFSGTAPISWWRLGENAYFDNNSFTVPNSIAGAPNGIGSGTVTTMLSADAPGTYANGIGDGLAITDRVGDAALSVANSQSYNMIPDDKVPYVPGYVGLQTTNNSEFTFNGIDDYFDLGTPEALNLTENMSISAWINTNTIASGTRVIICDCNTPPSQSQFCLEINRTAGKISALANGTTVALTGNTTLSINTWYHVALTRSGSTGNWNYVIYLNGVVDGSVTTSSNPSPQQGIAIGRFGESSSGYFSGQMDEIAIFDKALTADQIKFDLYNATTTGKTADIANNPNLPTPVAWYRMGD